jgi:hypothetical protein
MEAPKCKLCNTRHYGVCAEMAKASIKMAAPQPHHQAWLEAHPNRTTGWLRAHLSDGFHVHHLDGDHSNNHPENVMLLEETDHLRLHRKIAPVLRCDLGLPFDRNTYQRDYMRKARAEGKYKRKNPD